MTELFDSSSAQQVSQQFFEAAYARIVRNLFILVPCFAAILWMSFNRRFAIGFFVGGAIAIVNFLSLKKLVIAFADSVIASHGERRSSGLIARFVFRYGLVALATYAIFKSSAMSAYGLLAGLGIPAVGIIVEAGYEVYKALRHGY